MTKLGNLYPYSSVYPGKFNVDSEAGPFFSPIAYTGTGASRSVTGTGFQPDMTWIKIRSKTYDATLWDSERGVERYVEPSSSGPETTGVTDGLNSFDSDGFSIGGNELKVNENTSPFISWSWKQSVNAGFNMVQFTGNETNRTIAHSLDVAPEFIMFKGLTGVKTWYCYHKDLTSAAYAVGVGANKEQNVPTFWNSTAPTSSVFSLGTSTSVNDTDIPYEAWLFASKQNSCHVGVYTGNGSSSGPSITAPGFQPKAILIKNIDDFTQNWIMVDSARSAKYSYFNIDDAEVSVDLLDFTEDGFDIKNTLSEVNGSGNRLIYACWT
jgi:hypothetical protein